MARSVLTALIAPAALIGCSSSDSTSIPFKPPTTVTKVATGGFQSPTDAVASPDGKTFYFAAYTTDEAKMPAIFSTSSEPGSTAAALATGAPLEVPVGLVLSCDGSMLYIADIGGDSGSVLAMPTDGGAVSALTLSGIDRPGGLAMGPDCKTIYSTGRTAAGEPGLFSFGLEGGEARTIWSGEPLVSPTGMHIDNDGVSWVMDNRSMGASGEGVLYAIPQDGSAANEVISGLRMGTPGGVSLVSIGGTAVMPTRDEDGNAQLTAVHTATGESMQVAAPDIGDVAGIRTARNSPVMAVVDSENATIFRAE